MSYHLSLFLFYLSTKFKISCTIYLISIFCLQAILIGLGLQYKTIDDLANELGLSATQLLGLFNRLIRRCVLYLNGTLEKDVEKSMAPKKNVNLTPVAKSMHDELEEAAKELKKKQLKELEKLKNENLTQFAIKGSEEEWQKALTGKNKKSIISVKR